jgi:hypothetical protein
MSNYPLRLPQGLMKEARRMAEEQGVSINQFLSTLIAERIGELKAFEHVKARIERGNRKRARSVLARAPDRPPLRGDEMPK